MAGDTGDGVRRERREGSHRVAAEDAIERDGTTDQAGADDSPEELGEASFGSQEPDAPC
ncbi:unnamed protein product [Linum tenue]|uniref:Uncharacterized protein n=1 Tax=Linum tenue TaxID=586396 RepID=A0AAV0HZ90_9ROSI|nr:unnamed protein product [Linum tenue]